MAVCQDQRVSVGETFDFVFDEFINTLYEGMAPVVPPSPHHILCDHFVFAFGCFLIYGCFFVFSWSFCLFSDFLVIICLFFGCFSPLWTFFQLFWSFSLYLCLFSYLIMDIFCGYFVCFVFFVAFCLFWDLFNHYLIILSLFGHVLYFDWSPCSYRRFGSGGSWNPRWTYTEQPNCSSVHVRRWSMEDIRGI